MLGALSNTDREFLKRFALVVAGLHGIALLFIGIAYVIYTRHPPATSPDRDQSIAQRIAPVGAVYSGETGRAAALAAQQNAARATATGTAYGGSLDGKTIFDNLCQACHAAGVLGAPKLGDAAAWKPRIAQGVNTLVTHAVNGFTGQTGTMPPKGGNAALSDDQVKAAVQWMIGQVK